MLRKAFWGFAVFFLVCSGLDAAAARGRRGKKGARSVRVAILPVKAKGVTAKVANELGTTVFKELKEIGVFRFISPKQTSRKLRIMRKRKIYRPNCAENPKCIRRVGRRLRAKVLYYLVVAKARQGITLNMRTFDVKSGKEVRKGSEFATEDPADMERATRWLTRIVSGPMITTLARGKGRLEITCNEEGADLYLNGKSFGKRTGKSFKVGSGVFDIVVKKQGFKPFHDVVVVKPGQSRKVDAVIEKTGPEVPDVVAGVVDKGKEARPEKKPGEKKEDVPAWAVFEKKKDKPKPLVAGTDTKGDSGGGDVLPWQKKKAKAQPFLPDDGEEPVEPEPDDDGEDRFYETWWFWTIVGVAVAGGTAGGLYAAGIFGGEGNGGNDLTGSALLTWE